MINDDSTRDFIEAANRAVRQTGLLDQVNAMAQQLARASSSGLQEQVSRMMAAVDTSGLQEQLNAMVATIDNSGLQEQIRAITRPVAREQVDGLLGINQEALKQISERFASSSSWLELYRQSAVELQRRASEAVALDLTPQLEQLRRAASAAAEVAPDLVGPSASTEFVHSLVEDRETYPDVTLADVDERVGRALSQAASGNVMGSTSSKQEGLGTQLLLLVLAVAVDRAVPDREELLRLILILVHLIRHLG